MLYYPLLRNRIESKYGSLGKFAEKLGISQPQLSVKLCGRVKLTINDVENWSNLLDIPYDDIGKYFFANKVYNMDSVG